MGQTLKGTLYQGDPKTGSVASFPRGTAREKLPDWVAVDDGAFDGEPDEDAKVERDKQTRTAKEPDGSLPPKSGNGSSAVHWLAYARTEANATTLAAADIVIPDDAKREDIVAALESAGIATEKPAQ